MKAETSSLKLVQLATVLVVEYENEVKSHANTHTHTKLNRGNYICNLAASETLSGTTQKIRDILLYISYMIGRMYVL